MDQSRIKIQWTNQESKYNDTKIGNNECSKSTIQVAEVMTFFRCNQDKGVGKKIS